MRYFSRLVFRTFCRFVDNFNLVYMEKTKSVNTLALIILILVFLSFNNSTANSQKISVDAVPLDAEEAFKIDYIVTGPSEAVIRWLIPQFYYLYKEKFHFSSKDFSIEDVQLPTAQIREDPYFGESEVYYDVVEVNLRLTSITKNQKNGVLNISYQGCWEGGICYPLLKTPLTLNGL